jgi:hypothetical protein
MTSHSILLTVTTIILCWFCVILSAGASTTTTSTTMFSGSVRRRPIAVDTFQRSLEERDEGSESSSSNVTAGSDVDGEGDEEEEPTTTTGSSSSTSIIKDMCLQATNDLLNTSDDLKDAVDTFNSMMESNVQEVLGDDNNNDDLHIGFSQDAVTAYLEACYVTPGGYWSYVETANFNCHELSSDVKNNVPLTVYGMGNCLADTTDCKQLDPNTLMESIWKNVGLDCQPAEAGDGTTTTTTEEEEPVAAAAEEEEETTPTGTNTTMDETESNPPPPEETGDTPEEELGGEGDNGGGEQNPFLSAADAQCMGATETFAGELPELQSAANHYQQAVQMDGMDGDPSASNGMRMGYSDDAVAAMRAACDAAGGYWNVIESEQFTCTMNGFDAEQQSLDVYNYGSCLADTDECQNMDIAHLLESVWDVMGMNCWGSNDDEGNNVPPSTTENDPEDSTTTGGGDDEQPPTEDSNSGGGNDLGLDDLSLSDNDKKCMQATQAMAESNPDVSVASTVFGESMVIDLKDVQNMTLSFPDESVDGLKSVCFSNGGYFSLVSQQEFLCDMMGRENSLTVSNVANCFADTDECKDMNPLRLMESVFTAMKLNCREKSEDDEDTSGSHSDEQTGSGAAGHSDGGNSPGQSTEADVLGLSELEVGCMNDSDGFITSTEHLSDAAQEYAKHVQMNDPTRLGFPAEAAADMEGVCKDNGGIWSSITSEDVTCMIQGRERRINVYNFGNCIAKTDNCESMDPMVLVKAFFWEVLHFQCWPHGEMGPSGTTTTPNIPPSNQDPEGQTTGFSSSHSSTNPTNDDGLPGYATAVIVLCAIVAIGFFAFYKMRGSNGRDRSYEMTDVSDLRFDNFVT